MRVAISVVTCNELREYILTLLKVSTFQTDRQTCIVQPIVLVQVLGLFQSCPCRIMVLLYWNEILYFTFI